MRRTGIASLVVSAILVTLPATFANGAGGGGPHGFSGPVGSFGLRPKVAPIAPSFARPVTPGWRSWTPGWGWLGRPSAFGAPPSSLVPAPFHSPYAAPFWGAGAAPIFMKPDESTVLESESRMEEQVRALETSSPKDESPDSGSDAASDGDSSEWQPL
jgi:hypothetical protein